jgi:hypothetical protein
VAKVLSLATVVICLTFIVLAVSRTGAMLHNYNSTMDVYRHVYDNPTPGNQTICVGREWYRFWTHFFLPENYRYVWFDVSFSLSLLDPKAIAVWDFLNLDSVASFLNIFRLSMEQIRFHHTLTIAMRKKCHAMCEIVSFSPVFY